MEVKSMLKKVHIKFLVNQSWNRGDTPEFQKWHKMVFLFFLFFFLLLELSGQNGYSPVAPELDSRVTWLPQSSHSALALVF